MSEGNVTYSGSSDDELMVDLVHVSDICMFQQQVANFIGCSPEAIAPDTVARAILALSLLIISKNYKDKFGKNEVYEIMRSHAWKSADFAFEPFSELKKP